MYLSREEIDFLSRDLEIKGRMERAVICIRRERNGVLYFRHATGRNWYPVKAKFQAYASGASEPR